MTTPHGGVQVGLRAATQDQADSWRRAAELAGVPFVRWARAALDQMARSAVNDPKDKPGPAKARGKAKRLP